MFAYLFVFIVIVRNSLEVKKSEKKSNRVGFIGKVGSKRACIGWLGLGLKDSNWISEYRLNS